jgi:hypothetical protein
MNNNQYYNKNNELIEYYFNYDLSDKFIFRSCSIDEIKKLYINGKIYSSALDNEIRKIHKENFNYLYFSIDIDFASNFHEYLVIYNKEKLLKQGLIILPEDNIEDYLNLPKDYFEDLYNKGMFETFQEIEEDAIDTIKFGGKLGYSEAIIHEIYYESGLIENILVFDTKSQFHRSVEIRLNELYNFLKDKLK